MSLFCCPICGGPLERGPSAYSCPAGHRFDLAREGDVHLLPANRMHSKMPGDDKGMAAARAAFLSKGYYAPLRDALAALAVHSLSSALYGLVSLYISSLVIDRVRYGLDNAKVAYIISEQ